MKITYACPACGVANVADGLESRPSLACSACGAAVAVPPGAIDPLATADVDPLATADVDPLATADVGEQPARISRCVVCPSRDLFVRKDFPQRLGIGIVVVGFLASCVAWGMRELVWTFGILFVTAAIDVLLYLFMPECLTCYRCGARYRGPGVTERHGPFDLDTHERNRQAKARLQDVAAAGAVVEHR